MWTRLDLLRIKLDFPQPFVFFQINLGLRAKTSSKIFALHESDPAQRGLIKIRLGKVWTLQVKAIVAKTLGQIVLVLQTGAIYNSHVFDLGLNLISA